MILNENGERSRETRHTRPENVGNENLMRRPQIGETPKKYAVLPVMEKHEQKSCHGKSWKLGQKKKSWKLNIF